MAHPSTLYRFRIDLSDVDRGVYDALDFRVALHPSETLQYLVTRVLAFSLNAAEGLAFTPGGLSDPDSPCIQLLGEQNSILLWIEIGNPSARKLHKATKSSRAVRVYTYKDAELLLKEIAANEVYHPERIEIFSISAKFLDRLGALLEKDNRWSVMCSDGTLTVSVGDVSESIELLSKNP